MTTSDEPQARATKHRTVLIASVIALGVLGAIAAPLLLLTNGAANEDTPEPVPNTRPITPSERYDDPQGAYSLRVDPAWRGPSPAGGSDETWQTGTDSDPAGRLTVATKPAGRLDLDQYMQLVIKRAPPSVEDFALREFRVVTLPTDVETDVPEQLGVVAYDGRRGTKDVTVFVVVRMAGDAVIVATLTADKDRFDEVRTAIEPYLLTLRGT